MWNRDELHETEQVRTEIQQQYSKIKSSIIRFAESAAAISGGETLLALRNLAYICACSKDAQNAETIYRLALQNNIPSDVYTLHDFVIQACYEWGDIVTAFRWVLSVNAGKECALRLSIGATLDNFKFHPNLWLVYTDFLNTLERDYLPMEIGTPNHDVRDAVVVLCARLLQFDKLISIIEHDPTPSLSFHKLWLEHKWEAVSQISKDDFLEHIEEQTLFHWQQLAAGCSNDQNALLETGRLYYPLKWYMEHPNNQHLFFNKVLINLLYFSHHITRIKEMLNMPLSLFDDCDHITMYMRHRKLKRVFSKEPGSDTVTWKLTCADHMNDDFEGSVFFDYLKECHITIFDQWIRPFGILNGMERSSVFLGSVSCTYNDPYMFDLYANDQDGTGFCVDLDVRSFDDILEDSLANDEFEWICPLYKLIYADTIGEVRMPNVRREIKALGKSLMLIQFYTKDYEKSYPELIQSFYEMLYRMLEEIIYLFKKKSGPDNTIKDENGMPLVRSREREMEMRMMKCVRGDSKNITESEAHDSKNRNYRSYTTRRRIIVKDIVGGNNDEDLEQAQNIIFESQTDLTPT